MTLRIADETSAPAGTSIASGRTAPGAPRIADKADAHVGVGGTSKLEQVMRCTEAKAALTGLGWTVAIARKAVADASAALGPEATLERLIFEALRRCPRPA